MEHNYENITKVANAIVNDMDADDLISYVYDDLVGLMLEDEELFKANCENYHDTT